MRFLTALSALILAGAGAYCFAFYMNGYAGVAFILGIALILYGLFQVIAYCIGFRNSHLPESVFVDGVVSAALGFLAIADLIPDGSISIYFGFGLLTSGVCRLTEALAVSKINPKNWFAVLPLGIINTIFGFVLLVPEFLTDVNDLYAIAIAMILQAFSIAIYALYMVKRTESAKAKEAKERAQAKKLAAEEARKERDRKRSLSEQEREAEIEKARLAKVKLEEEKAEARKAKKESRRPASEKTMSFTAEETEEIVKIAEKEKKDAQDTKVREILESAEEITDTSDVVARPVFNKPTNIPTIEKAAFVPDQKTDDLKIEQKRGLVNLEEIESKVPEIDLPTPEIAEPEIKSEGGEALNRQTILKEIKAEKAPAPKEDDLTSFTPLSLEDLFSDEQYNIKPLSDRKSAETDLKLTQTFTFDWLDKK